MSKTSKSSHGGFSLFGPWNRARASSEGRAFLQHRIALLARLMFWIFFALSLMVLTMHYVWPELASDRSHISDISGGALIALNLVVWLLCRGSRVLPTYVLHLIDGGLLVSAGVSMAVGFYAQCDLPSHMYSSYFWQCFMVFARALVVPSSGRRTLFVSIAAMLPMIVAALLVGLIYPQAIELPGPIFLFASIMMSAVPVILAATGSRIIYGLRKQVHEALQLGQYTLDDKIGEGGMGAVYRAHHVLLRRPTAIKLLRPERAGDESLQRFEREVQATAELTHPNTVEIYDYGRTPEGVFYYAMEFLPGVDLESLVRRWGPQPPARVIHILAQVCGALAEAHGRGLIHRDIKPANIILCQRGGIPDVAKVVDFGLVKEIQQDAGLTGVDAIHGTPAYLSPEAITSPQGVGPQSDLYALGAVGYFLLTGAVLFDTATVIQTCIHHVETVPPVPSQKIEGPIPDALDQLIMRCLEKQPSARPASAESLQDALHDLQNLHPWPRATAKAWWSAFAAVATPPTVLATEDTELGSPLTISTMRHIGEEAV